MRVSRVKASSLPQVSIHHNHNQIKDEIEIQIRETTNHWHADTRAPNAVNKVEKKPYHTIAVDLPLLNRVIGNTFQPEMREANEKLRNPNSLDGACCTHAWASDNADQSSLPLKEQERGSCRQTAIHLTSLTEATKSNSGLPCLSPSLAGPYLGEVSVREMECRWWIWT